MIFESWCLLKQGRSPNIPGDLTISWRTAQSLLCFKEAQDKGTFNRLEVKVQPNDVVWRRRIAIFWVVVLAAIHVLFKVFYTMYIGYWYCNSVCAKRLTWSKRSNDECGLILHFAASVNNPGCSLGRRSNSCDVGVEILEGWRLEIDSQIHWRFLTWMIPFT